MGTVSKEKIFLRGIDGNMALYEIPINFKKATGLFYIGNLDKTPINLRSIREDSSQRLLRYETYANAKEELLKIGKEWNTFIEQSKQESYLLIYFRFKTPKGTNDICNYAPERIETHVMALGMKEVTKIGNKYYEVRQRGTLDGKPQYERYEYADDNGLSHRNLYAIPNTPEAKLFFENMLASFCGVTDKINNFFEKVGVIDFTKEVQLLIEKERSDG